MRYELNPWVRFAFGNVSLFFGLNRHFLFSTILLLVTFVFACWYISCIRVYTCLTDPFANEVIIALRWGQLTVHCENESRKLTNSDNKAMSNFLYLSNVSFSIKTVLERFCHCPINSSLFFKGIFIQNRWMDRSCLMFDENQRSSLCSTSHFWTWAAPQRRRKEAKSRRLNSHTLTLFFPACFFSKLTYTMCRTYIVYTCTSPLPSPFSPFLHKVLLSAWCGELPDKKTPSL